MFLTPEEVAEQLRVSRRTVYAWLHSGRLRAAKAGKHWRIRPEDIETFLRPNDDRKGDAGDADSPQTPL